MHAFLKMCFPRLLKYFLFFFYFFFYFFSIYFVSIYFVSIYFFLHSWLFLSPFFITLSAWVYWTAHFPPLLVKKIRARRHKNIQKNFGNKRFIDWAYHINLFLKTIWMHVLLECLEGFQTFLLIYHKLLKYNDEFFITKSLSYSTKLWTKRNWKLCTMFFFFINNLFA